MAHVVADSLRGALGTTIEYVFSDTSDATAYRSVRRAKLKWRDEAELIASGTIFLGFFAYSGFVDGWRFVTVLAFLVGPIILYSQYHFRFVRRYLRIELTIHPTWLGLKEERRRNWFSKRPFASFVSASQARAVDWLDDGCLIRRKWFVFSSMYIDGRLLAQHGAIDAICEWASRHGIEVNGNVPILADE